MKQKEIDYFVNNYDGSDISLQTLAYILKHYKDNTDWIPKTSTTKRVHEAQGFIYTGHPETISAAILAGRVSDFVKKSKGNDK